MWPGNCKIPVMRQASPIRNSMMARALPFAGLLLACLLGAVAAWASGPLGKGVLVHLNTDQVASFDARHTVHSTRLNPNRDLYLITATDGRTDQQLLDEIKTDPHAVHPTLNIPVKLSQSTASVLNESTVPVLSAQSTASVLNQSTASVLNSDLNFYGTHAPSDYVNQPAVNQVAGGAAAHALATGRGVVVALIDNGVDQFNPVLAHVLLRREGYNFFDGTPNWSAYADLGQSTASVLNQSTASVLNQSTASVLNGQSTASVLNDAGEGEGFQSTASVLNQSTASVLNACLSQSTASVLNGQSTASVLNDASENFQSTASVLNGQSTASVLNQSTASVLNGSQALVMQLIQAILACDADFGHGTAVAGLIHLIAPEAEILPIKAFGPNGAADAAVIYQSLTYAIDHGANVINLSFSATGLDPNVQAAIIEAVGKGIIVTAAAGNNSDSDPVFPASLPGVVGVGAVDGCNAATTPPPAAGTVNPCSPDPALNLATFSDVNPSSGIVDDDVAAPGVQLFSTFPGFGLVWATVSGTSFSTPLVAGEAALLVQLRQNGVTNRTDIENTADPSIPGDLNGALGHGLVQVLGALRMAPTPTSHTHSH